MLKTEWIKQGFIDEPVAEGTDLKAEIRRLAKEKGAFIYDSCWYIWLRKPWKRG